MSAAIGTHVDDLLGIGPTEELDATENLIEGEVELDKRGRPEKMLGMESHWDTDQVILTQMGLIETTAKNYKLTRDGLKQSLPLDSSYYKKGEELDEKADQKKFQSLVGSLLFIGRMIRLDIAIHVNRLGWRMADPTTKNYRAALQVLSYLRATHTEEVTLKRPPNLEIRILSNAAYGGEKA